MTVERIGGTDPAIIEYRRNMQYLQALEAGDDGWADAIEATANTEKSPAVQLLQSTAVSTCVDGRIAS